MEKAAGVMANTRAGETPFSVPHFRRILCRLISINAARMGEDLDFFKREVNDRSLTLN